MNSQFRPYPRHVSHLKHSSATRINVTARHRHSTIWLQGWHHAGGRRWSVPVPCCIPPPDLEGLYTGSFKLEGPWHGPVEIQGKQGSHASCLVASRNVSAGQLLLAAPSVAVAYGPRAIVPEVNELARLLRCQELLPRDKAWLEYIWACSQNLTATPPALSTTTEADGCQEEKPNSNSALPASATQPAALPFHPKDIPLNKLQAAVSNSVFAEEYEDLGICGLRREWPQAYLGLWGPLSLLRHSCASNTSQLVVGHVLLLTATANIPAGEPLSMNYLGKKRFAPLHVRRCLLAEQYGFLCSCPRCTAEHSTFGNYTETVPWWRRWWLATTQPNHHLLAVLHQRYSTNPLAMVLHARDFPADRDKMLEEVEGALSQLEGALRRMEVTPRERLWMLACVYDMLKLHQQLLELDPARGDAALAALRTRISVADSVSRGSDMHLFLLLELVRKVEYRYGAASPEAREADGYSVFAHQVRYGPVSRALLGRLILMRRRYVVGSGIAARLSDMGWEAAGKVETPGSRMVKELEKYLEQADPAWLQEQKQRFAAGPPKS